MRRHQPGGKRPRALHRGVPADGSSKRGAEQEAHRRVARARAAEERKDTLRHERRDPLPKSKWLLPWVELGHPPEPIRKALTARWRDLRFSAVWDGEVWRGSVEDEELVVVCCSKGDFACVVAEVENFLLAPFNAEE